MSPAEYFNMLLTGKPVVDWMHSRSEEFQCKDAVGIGWHDGRQLVAGVGYTDYNGVNVCMHVVADGKTWLRRPYLWACFDYPFRQLGVKRVTGLVGEGNAQARRFDEHLGFELETTLKAAHPTGDLLVYVMWKDSCRWINPDFAKRYALAA